MAVEKNLRVSIKFYKKHCIPVTIWNKNNLSNQVAAITYTLETGLSAFAILLKVCESFLLRKSKKKLVVDFGLYETSLDFRRREEQINTTYEK